MYMHPIHHIRTKVFHVTQDEIARIAEVKQATVSRWESGKLKPGLGEMERIRTAALERGLPWDDTLFFETPVSEAAQ